MSRCCACTAENLAVVDTDSIDLTLIAPGILHGDLRVDPNVTYQLSVSPAGVFVPPGGGGGGAFSDLIQMSDNSNIATFPDSAPAIIQWDPAAVGGATFRLVGTGLSWGGLGNESRIVCNTTGYYDFYTSIAVTGPTDADAYGFALFYINGVPSNYGLPSHVWFPQNAIVATVQGKLIRISLTAGDYVEVAGLFVGSATLSNQGLMVEAVRVA